MSVDADTVRRIAHLARIAVADSEVENLRAELNAMLAFVEQLSEVDIAGVEPMAHAFPVFNVLDDDIEQPGFTPAEALRNAPALRDNQFLVPKVVEDAS